MILFLNHIDEGYIMLNQTLCKAVLMAMLATPIVACEQKIESPKIDTVEAEHAFPKMTPERSESIDYNPPTPQEKYGYGLDVFKRGLLGINFNGVEVALEQVDKVGVNVPDGLKEAIEQGRPKNADDVLSEALKTVKNNPSIPSDPDYSFFKTNLEPKDIYKEYEYKPTKCSSNSNIVKIRDAIPVNGDTLTVSTFDNELFELRLVGIDAPELKQSFGRASKKRLNMCVSSPRKEVFMEWTGKDADGRLLGKIISDNRDCGLVQLHAGMAWHYKQYADQQPEFDRKQYSNAEFHARIAEKGLWINKNNVAPWNFRNGEKHYEREFNSQVYDLESATCDIDS